MFDTKTINLLIDKARSLGLNPRLLTSYGLISIEVNGREEFLFHSYSVLNSQLSSYLASNKHAARTVFEEVGLPNIPFCLPSEMHEAAVFLAEHKSIVAKPTMGMRSQDIHLVSTVEELQALDLSKYILEKYISGKEIRYLLLNNEILAVHHKLYNEPINNPKTVKRIAYEKHEWNEGLIELSKKITSSLGLSFAAVDFILGNNDRPYILEVNSAPGLARFDRPDQGPGIDIATIFLQATLDKLGGSNNPRQWKLSDHQLDIAVATSPPRNK